MSQKWTDQTSDVDSEVTRIVLRERYSPDFESVVTKPLVFPIVMDSALSPPLSEIELADVRVAEEEFLSGQSEIYEDAQDLINSLHTARERYKREAGGQ